MTPAHLLIAYTFGEPHDDPFWTLMGLFFLLLIPYLCVMSVIAAVRSGRKHPGSGDKSNLF
ncbi:MAG: hypothetical protein ACOYOQ_14860 [Microthrixaceae bacterium]